MTQSIEQRTTVGSAIEEICGTLPDGWEIVLEMASGSATVELYNAYGDHIPDYPTNHESLSSVLRDAVQFARECDESERHDPSPTD